MRRGLVRFWCPGAAVSALLRRGLVRFWCPGAAVSALLRRGLVRFWCPGAAVSALLRRGLVRFWCPGAAAAREIATLEPTARSDRSRSPARPCRRPRTLTSRGLFQCCLLD
ncbi:hypothetical protein HMPREF0970_02355 [Schaalia odontolytica F0309]|uniref:Uncharacterized protein n=1 Tax=Schaalia odontolytica F0309 TaxID=649742 RepID=D4U2B0_9ACTO|nr:hypothetical protein HMPREF0970_02355 [Schaalia odontolytica F0309]